MGQIHENFRVKDDGTIERSYSEFDKTYLNIIRLGANKDGILSAFRARRQCYKICKKQAKEPNYKVIVDTLQLDNFPNEFKKAELGKKYVWWLVALCVCVTSVFLLPIVAFIIRKMKSIAKSIREIK